MELSSIIATWQRVLLQPGEEAFVAEAQQPGASLTTGVIWMVIAGVVAGVLGGLRAALFAGAGGLAGMMGADALPPEVARQFGPLLATATGASGFAAIITIPVFFLVGVLILHLLATVLGGRGDFGKLGYLVAAFQAPITVVSALFGLLPILGGCVSVLLAIYGLVLEYFAVKVNYSLSSGRAIAVVLFPIILLALLALCIAVVVGVAVAGLGS